MFSVAFARFHAHTTGLSISPLGSHMLLRPRRRRLKVENLERRHLLTTVAPDLIYWPSGDQFTVRRDEAEPVELHLNFGFDAWRPILKPESDLATIDSIDSANGSAKIAPGGRSILYQPPAGFLGIDIITVTLRTADEAEVRPVDGGATADTLIPDIDDGGDADSINRQIAINVVEPLLAVDDWFETQVNGQPIELDVLANDIRNAQYIGDQPVLKVQEYRGDSGGMIAMDQDHVLLMYTPAADFEGVETIVYTAVDDDGYTVEGRAQVRVANGQRDTLWPEQLQQQLTQKAIYHHRYSFGAAAYPGHDGRYYFAFEDGLALANAGPPDASTTNNQIAEVDESDRVKTDGEFLYVLSSPNQSDWFGWDILPWIEMPREFAPIPEPRGENLLTIIDLRQPDAPLIVSRQLFEDRVLSLDLQGNRLTVFSQRELQTVVTTLDVSDRQTIRTVWTTVVDGRFKQARRVGERLYVFTDEHGINIPPLETICDDGEEFCFYETGQKYLLRVADSLIESVFPSQQVFDANGDKVDDVPSMLVDPLEAGVPDYYGRLNVITFDTTGNVGGAIDWDISAAGEHVLVTPASIYVTRTDYQSSHSFPIGLPIFTDIPERPSISTQIERFAIEDDGTVKSSAVGAVPGVLNNSFSLDEHDGLLRIATEKSWWSVSADDDGTNIYVLTQTGDAFEVIGGVNGLAPGEQIYAVRFAGNRGYVVTFRRVDPLFVVDLSEPTAPQVLGELKTPGYSQYLHVIDENHLIGIGRDADQQTGLYQGLIVSLFNVSDPVNPLVQDRYEFEGGRTTFSPFAEDNPWDLRDHHAISYFAESGILALPIYSKHNHWVEQGDQPIFESPQQSAVRTLRIDRVNGIEELDSIPFDSRADRTVRIGEHLYSLSNEELKVTHLLKPDGVIASLKFERSGKDDFVDTEVGDPVTIDVTDNDGVGNEVEILDARLLEGEGEVVVDGKRIRFTPSSRSLSQHRIRYTARDAAGTLIDAIATVDPDLQWQNRQETLDVNNDGKRSALDALIIINWVDRYGTVDSEDVERQIGDADSTKLYYFDTSGDGTLSTRDALLIINDLTHEVLVTVTPIGNPSEPADPETEPPDFVDQGIQPEAEKVAAFDAPAVTQHEAIDLAIADFAQEDGNDSDEDL